MSTEQKRFVTPKGRLLFPHLFHPKKPKENSPKEKYMGVLLLDKEAQKDPRFQKLVQGVQAAIKAEWPNKTPIGLKLPFKKGDRLRNKETGEFWPGCDEETIAFNFQSDFAPEVKNQRKDTLVAGEAKDEAQIYGGCYVHISVTPKAINMPENKCVTMYLGNVIKVAEGDPIGSGRVSADKDFEGIEAIEIDVDLNDDGSDINLDDIQL